MGVVHRQWVLLLLLLMLLFLLLGMVLLLRIVVGGVRGRHAVRAAPGGRGAELWQGAGVGMVAAAAVVRAAGEVERDGALVQPAAAARRPAHRCVRAAAAAATGGQCVRRAQQRLVASVALRVRGRRAPGVHQRPLRVIVLHSPPRRRWAARARAGRSDRARRRQPIGPRPGACTGCLRTVGGRMVFLYAF